MSNNRKFGLIIILSWIVFLPAISQNTLNSPYSRYGPGEIVLGRYGTNFEMGGLSMAYRSPLCINPVNPASLTALDQKSFLMSFNLGGNVSQLEKGEFSHQTGTINFSGLSFAFPVTKWWFSGFSLQPYSRTSYNISEKDSLADGTTYSRTYKGAGGFNLFGIANAFKVHKYLSLSAKVSYLFGSLNQEREILYPSATNMFSLAKYEKFYAGDVLFNFGAQFHFDIADKYFVNVGGSYENSRDLRAEYNVISYRFDYLSDFNRVRKDTLLHQENVADKMTMPSSWSLGFIAGIKEKLMFGADYSAVSWSDFRFFGLADTLRDASRLSIGIAYIPDYNESSTSVLTASGKYFRKVEYRAGFRSEKTPVSFGDYPLNDIGISFGLALPITRFPKFVKRDSYVNLGVELGKRSTGNNEGLTEKYMRFSVGFTFYNNWFFRPKYD